MTGRARPEPRDQGQAVPLAVMLLFFAVGIALVATEIGKTLNDSARARTASDAAALAGAAAGRAEAASLAAANGGQLLSYDEHTPTDGSGVVTVTVSVKVGRATEVARAEGLVEWATVG